MQFGERLWPTNLIPSTPASSTSCNKTPDCRWPRSPTRENLDIFEKAVANWPEVVQCATITGREDYVLRIITSDMHTFDKFLRDKLLTLGIVSDCASHIVTRGVKNVTTLPLSIITPHVS